MRFTSPAHLLLLAGLGWFWWTMRRRASTGLQERHGWRHHALRPAVASLLILAAAGLEVIVGTAPLSVAFVMDTSDSMAGASTQVRRQIEAASARLLTNDQAALIVFGAEPALERSLAAPVATLAAPSASVSASDTDIEAALRMARTSLPAAGLRRIVLFTDGQQTRGNALTEAALAAAEGIPIDVAPPLETIQRRAPVVSRVSAPPVAAVGEPFQISVVAAGPPGETAQLVLESEHGPAATQEVFFSTDGVATATHLIRQPQPGVYTYTARITSAAPDPLGIDSEPSDGAVVVVTGNVRALHVGESAFDAIPSAALSVDHVGPTSLPRTAAALSLYDTVILDDVRPDTFDENQTAAVAQHVERGGGLLVLGSARTLDTSIAPNSGIGRLFPIDLRPRAGTRAPELALVLVFDKSGSMDDRVGGAAKIEYARQGVQRVLDAMPPTDSLGVIAFDSAPTVIAPLSVGHDARAIAERLRAIVPAGSTAIAPAVQRAIEWLNLPAAAALPRRHILLVTDGRSSQTDAADLQQLVRATRIPVSVISLGGDRDERFLRALAAENGGRAYFPDDAQALPMLAAREAALVGGGHVVEELFTPRPSPHPMIAGVNLDGLPRLGGYVVSAAKPGAEVPLASHRLDPVVATWRYGLGRVATYTADLQGPWSALLRSSTTFAPLLTQMVRWTARSTSDRSLYVTIREQGERAVLMVEAPDQDGRHVSLLDVTASIRPPSGDIEEVSLMETVPGRYEAPINADEPGSYVVAVEGRSRDGAFASQLLRGYYRSAGAEGRATGVNMALLKQLSDTTGGTVFDGRSDPFSAREPDFRDARPWLLGAAFVLFLLDLLVPAVTAMLTRSVQPASYSVEKGAAA